MATANAILDPHAHLSSFPRARTHNGNHRSVVNFALHKPHKVTHTLTHAVDYVVEINRFQQARIHLKIQVVLFLRCTSTIEVSVYITLPLQLERDTTDHNFRLHHTSTSVDMTDKQTHRYMALQNQIYALADGIRIRFTVVRFYSIRSDPIVPSLITHKHNHLLFFLQNQ